MIGYTKCQAGTLIELTFAKENPRQEIVFGLTRSGFLRSAFRSLRASYYCWRHAKQMLRQ